MIGGYDTNTSNSPLISTFTQPVGSLRPLKRSDDACKNDEMQWAIEFNRTTRGEQTN